MKNKNVFSKFILVFVILFAQVSLSFASPLQTDDTGLQGTGKYQITLGANITADKASDVKTNTKQFNMSINYGVKDDIDLLLGIPSYTYSNFSNADSTQAFGDSSLGIKWAFIKSGDFIFVFRPTLLLPTGNTKYGGTGHLGMNNTLIISKAFEGANSIHLNLGNTINKNNIGQRESLFQVYLGSFIKLSEKVTFDAEVGTNTNPDKSSSQMISFATGGFTYSVNENLDIDLAYRHGLSTPATDSTGIINLVIKF